MRIKKVNIKNYKSFKDVALSDLSNINMIYGYNNSGKSNVLKFLDLLFSPKEDPERKTSGAAPSFWSGIINDTPFIFKDNVYDKDISFEVSIEIQKSELKLFSKKDFAELEKIYFKDNHSYITLKMFGRIVYLNFLQSEIRLDSVLINKKNIYDRNNKEPYFPNAPAKSTLKNNGYYYFITIMDLFTNSVQFLDNDRYFINENEMNEFSLNQINSKKVKNWFFQLSLLPEHHNFYLELIKFISNFDLKTKTSDSAEENSPLKNMELSFYKKNGEIDLIMQNEVGNRLPITSYGTGIQQIFYILTKIFSTNAKILLVEELELNLSPLYQRLLLKNLLDLIQKHRISQVIFTTHSKYFQFRNDFRLYEVDINDQGDTSIKRVQALNNKFFTLDDLA
jgi:AAA15 family ATPase/GTPase